MTEKELIDMFIHRLTELRMQRGLSAREMSRTLGRSESLINQIENHKIMPSMTFFFQICIFFNIHPKDFFNINIKDPSAVEELQKIISTLSSEQTNALLLFLHSILH